MARDKFVSKEAQVLLSYMEKEGGRKFDILKNEAAEKENTISSALAAELFSPSRATSISRLETYATCPFMHFIDYGLSPKELNEYSANFLDIGKVLHSTLEQFTRNALNKATTRQECYNEASEIFDKLLPDVHFGAMLSTERQIAFNAMLKNIACEGAWQIKKHINNFKIIGEEISFGKGKYPPIEIKTNYGTLCLNGKIDRADMLDKDGQIYLRIIDYKSGSKTFSENNLSEGTDLQLAIYMSALLSSFKNSVPASAQYMSVTENTFSGPELVEFNEKGVTREHFDYLLDTAKETATNLAENMLKGNIETKKSTACTYCKFSAVCGIKHKEDKTDAKMD